jgi:hypothetical protein
MQKVSPMSESRVDLKQSLDRDLQSQIDDLSNRVAGNRHDLDALEGRADASDARQDASDARQDASDARQDRSDARADASDARQDRTEARLGLLEASAAVDIELIAELASEWEFGRERAAQLEQALQSSRMIGAAIGIVMAGRKVTPAEAFETLTVASQHANRKLRDVAADIVDTGDVSELPTVLAADSPRR